MEISINEKYRSERGGFFVAQLYVVATKEKKEYPEIQIYKNNVGEYL